MERAADVRRDRIPALDGLRGLAVAGVLAFHAGAGWATGGFLGVSAFFTLSGFLICSLLLEEQARTGRIDLRAFWARRARRLLPASLVALVGVLGYAAFVGPASQLGAVRTDVVAALGYVANWRFLASSQSYADLFRAPSPAQHFWSLAIEEQFYVAFPLVVVAAVVAGRRVGHVRSVVGAALLALLVGSLIAAAVVRPEEGADPSRSYYGTDVRAAELLVGAVLAVGWRRRRSAAVVARWVAPVALGVVLWSWGVVDQTDGRLYAGGLVAHAVAVALLIVAAHGTSLTARALAAAPLRWLGRVSYGAYLYHWPLFLWLTPDRVGHDGVALAAVRLASTLLVAQVSLVVLEEPIRTGRRLRTGPARLALAGAVAMTLAAVAVMDADVAPPPLASAASPAPAPAPPTLPVASFDTLPVVAAEPAPPPAAPLRVYVAGDSVALRLGLHLQRWATAASGMEVSVSGWLACPAARGGAYRYAGVAKRTSARCNDWAAIRARELEELQPDVVVVSHGVFDVLDRRLPGSSAWQHLGQPDYDEYVRRELTELRGVLSSRGARVVWLTTPYIQTGGDETGLRPPKPFPEWEHSRMDRYNDLVREVGGADVVDVQLHLREEWGDEQDPTRRPDGIHPSEPATDELVAWLGPLLLAGGRAS